MRLSALKVGDTAVIKGWQTTGSTRAFLENLGFVEGSSLTVLTKCGKDLVVRLMDSRVALAGSLADALIVS
jgi:ferrous iron transport protein A